MRIYFLFLSFLLSLFTTHNVLATGVIEQRDDVVSWKLIIHDDLKSPSPQNFATRNYIIFQYFLDESLHGYGKSHFREVSESVRNHIFWKKHGQKNIYLDAFHRSYPIIKDFHQNDVPEVVFLIPYLESLWHSKGGKPAADYGYWQMVRSVVKEIQSLNYVPEELRVSDPDEIRSNPELSTTAAMIHLKRYYFYFAKVAGYKESEAWLFTMLAYNWGAGNVKRMLAEMKLKGYETDFSSFYDYLYKTQKQNTKDRSMKAALEYLPRLWNIALVINKSF